MNPSVAPQPHGLRSILGWMILAIVLRVGYSLSLPPKMMYPDEASFDRVASALATTGQYGAPQPTATRTPGYTIFLAGLYALFGHSIVHARLAQAFFGALMVLGVYQLSLLWLGSQRAAFWAAGCAAVYPFFIFYDAKFLSDAYATVWLTGWLLATAAIQQRSSDPWAWIAWGISAAVVCLTKVALLPVCAIVLMVEIFRSIRSDRGARALVLTAIAMLLWSGPLLLWGFRNQHLFGRWTLDTHGGTTMMETVVFHDAVKQGTFNAVWDKHPLRPTVDAIRNEAARDEYCRHMATDFIHANPRLYARQSLTRLKDFWRLYPRPDISFHEGTWKLIVVSLLTEPFLIFLGFYGLWKTRARWRALYPAYLLIACLTAVHTLVTGQMRYRLPLMPVLIIMSVYVMVQTLEHQRKRAIE